MSINFLNTIETADAYVTLHGFPCAALASANTSFDLTTDLTEIVAQTAVTDTDNYVCIDLEVQDIAGDGLNKSFYHLVANDHLFGSISRS